MPISGVHISSPAFAAQDAECEGQRGIAWAPSHSWRGIPRNGLTKLAVSMAMLNYRGNGYWMRFQLRNRDMLRYINIIYVNLLFWGTMGQWFIFISACSGLSTEA